MKKIFFIMAFLICLSGSNEMYGQTYMSKPTAIKNLSDEAKYLDAQIPQLELVDPNEYTIALQKRRIINNLLWSLKTSENVIDVVDQHVPSGDVRKLQSGVALFVPPTGNKNRLEWLRNEILQLISI